MTVSPVPPDGENPTRDMNPYRYEGANLLSRAAWDSGYSVGFAAGRAAAPPDPPDGPIPGPDPGACPRCGEWRKAGMIHRCPAATPDQNWADEDAARRNPMTDVPPEIEKLRWDAKMLHGKPAGTVWLADAEAAVLACEERCDALRARQQGTLRRVLGEIGAVLRDETATNTTKVAQIAGIMANGPLDDAPGGPCEQAVEAARLDERERLSARVYENGWCPTCGKKAVVT